MSRSLSLDAIDWQILRELQADGALSNVELARRVGLTPPPCLRRVRQMREAGFINGFRAVLNSAALGYPVVFFAFVQLATQAEKDLAAFQAAVMAAPQIRECWTTSGDIDFVLKCAAPDLASLQRFVGELTGIPNVRNLRTALALTKVKDEGLVPFNPQGVAERTAQ